MGKLWIFQWCTISILNLTLVSKRRKLREKVLQNIFSLLPHLASNESMFWKENPLGYLHLMYNLSFSFSKLLWESFKDALKYKQSYSAKLNKSKVKYYEFILVLTWLCILQITTMTFNLKGKAKKSIVFRSL